MRWIFSIPGAFVYFLSGIVASAAVNIVTGLLDFGGGVSELSMRLLLVISATAVSVFLGLMAWQIDSVGSQLRDMGVQNLTRDERKDLISSRLEQQAKSLRVKVVCVVVATCVGIGAIAMHIYLRDVDAHGAQTLPAVSLPSK